MGLKLEHGVQLGVLLVSLCGAYFGLRSEMRESTANLDKRLTVLIQVLRATGTLKQDFATASCEDRPGPFIQRIGDYVELRAMKAGAK